MPDDHFTIRVQVDGKYYPITIHRSDEGKIRQAAKQLNDKIELYKKRFGAGEKYDYLAMAAIQLATQLVDLKEQRNVNPVFDVLRELDEDLSQFFDSPRK